MHSRKLSFRLVEVPPDFNVDWIFIIEGTIRGIGNRQFARTFDIKVILCT
jgi:hypothetical protein